MKTCLALRGLMAAIGLLLPLCAGAESHLGAGATGAKTYATAHVDFRIVIPSVLSLGIGDIAGAARGTTGLAVAENRPRGSQKVAIYSNNRNVSLTASSAAVPAVRHDLILHAAAGKVIARETDCQIPADRGREVSPTGNAMICTVSMP